MKDAQKYKTALELMKQKDYRKAQELLLELYQQNPYYRAVGYFLAKTYYQTKQAKKAQNCALRYLEDKNAKKSAQAYKLLAKIALQQKDYIQAKQYLLEAKKHGLEDKSLNKLSAILLKKEDKSQVKANFKCIGIAKNKTPIAQSSALRYTGIKFLINGMSEFQKKNFNDGHWHELTVTKITSSGFKGFVTCWLIDERKFHQKYLPKLPNPYLRTAFNDYLEEDKFFKHSWQESKVFALLTVPGFRRQNIAELLKLNILLKDKEKEHLQACEDLVVLKKLGESLPLTQKDKLAQLNALYDFGYLCPKNCQKTLHLKQKCSQERFLISLLKQQSRHRLPLKSNAKFKPTPEQQAFCRWLKNQNADVLALLGVGGSGKTYTLGKILDASKVLALAPTHKARLNLQSCGFFQNDTIQKLLFEIKQGQDPLKDSPVRVILIDEVSMITLDMLSELMRYTGRSVRYLLIGDDRQLAPVSQDEEALAICGNVMALLQKYGQCFYFKENMRCKNPRLKPLIQACRDADLQTLAHVEFKTSDVRAMLNYKYQHQNNERCIILAYKNLTVAAINRKFYEVLTKDVQCKVEFYEKNGYGRGGYFVGAQVVFYRNDDQKQKYGYTNSEFGTITRLVLPNKKLPQGLVSVKTMAGTYHLPLERAKEDLLLAYALTIHKAQGSGADRVYVIEAYDRGLGYTAVSRARRELYFVKMTREDLLKSIAHPAQVKQNIY